MTILLHVVSTTACEKQQPILTGLKKEDRIFELDLRYRKIWVKGGKSRLKKGGEVQERTVQGKVNRPGTKLRSRSRWVHSGPFAEGTE